MYLNMCYATRWLRDCANMWLCHITMWLGDNVPDSVRLRYDSFNFKCTHAHTVWCSLLSFGAENVRKRAFVSIGCAVRHSVQSTEHSSWLIYSLGRQRVNKSKIQSYSVGSCEDIRNIMNVSTAALILGGIAKTFCIWSVSVRIAPSATNASIINRTVCGWGRDIAFLIWVK